MTDPERWSVSADAPAEIRALLRAARDEAPGPEITARLDERLAIARATPADPAAVPGWIAPSGLVAVLAVGLGVAWSSWDFRVAPVSVGHSTRESSPVVIEATPRTNEHSTTSDDRDQSHARSTMDSMARRSSTAKPTELELIRAARRALPGSPAESLRTVEQHRRLYPAGKLAQEREVLAVQALTRLGRNEEAEARARAFSARHPSSAHKSRVERETSSSPSESERASSTHPQ